MTAPTYPLDTEKAPRWGLAMTATDYGSAVHLCRVLDALLETESELAALREATRPQSAPAP